MFQYLSNIFNNNNNKNNNTEDSSKHHGKIHLIMHNRKKKT